MIKEVITKYPQLIKEDNSNRKLDLKILNKKSKAKTPANLILSYAKRFKKDGNLEMTILFQEIYKQLSYMEISEKIRINSWRGKGNIKIWEKPDRIIVEFAGKRDKNDKPNIQKREYLKEEINKMIFSINKLKDKFNNKIPSRELGEDYFQGGWDLRVFSNRSDHHKFTHILNILDYYKIIQYNRAGFTTVLRNVREIQEVLK
jgi:hypothetical protein